MVFGKDSSVIKELRLLETKFQNATLNGGKRLIDCGCGLCGLAALLASVYEVRYTQLLMLTPSVPEESNKRLVSRNDLKSKVAPSLIDTEEKLGFGTCRLDVVFASKFILHG